MIYPHAKAKQFFLLLASSLTLFNLSAKEFAYQFTQGDQFRSISTVNQQAGWLDEGDFTNHQFINRISFTVTNVDASGAGELLGEMHTSEQIEGEESSLWEKGYTTRYWLERLGKHRVGDHLFLPAVRHVPAFPSRDIKVGEKWIHPGQEVLDLRRNSTLNITKPYIVPFNGEYIYKGEVKKEAKSYHLIELTYKWSINIPEAFLTAKRRQGVNVTKNIQGNHTMKIYWDDEVHQPAIYEEEYQYRFTLEDNSVYVMQGTAEAYLIMADKMDKDEMIDAINEEIERLGIDDVRVERDEDGINLIMENIQFNPNSAYLNETEREKLAKIAQILRAYPDRDLEIVGHTAKAVNELAAKRLSEQRALSVANFFIKDGARAKEQIITRGEGSRMPIATNDTPEGMEKNRRVEIKIREN